MCVCVFAKFCKVKWEVLWLYACVCMLLRGATWGGTTPPVRRFCGVFGRSERFWAVLGGFGGLGGPNAKTRARVFNLNIEHLIYIQ